MSFKVTISGLDVMASLTLATGAVIVRRVYDHSLAEITLWWHEGVERGARQTAGVAAMAVGRTIEIAWQGQDGGRPAPCFHGYVVRGDGVRTAGKSALTLHCASLSKRTDIVPRFRAFQDCALLDICRRISNADRYFRIDNASDLQFDIPLSVQYDETDFAYLSRMLHAWGVPMAVSEKPGLVRLGARGNAAKAFPDIDFRWTSVSFTAHSDYYAERAGGGGGPAAVARQQVARIHDQLKTTAADYAAIEDIEHIRARQSSARSQTDTGSFHLVLDGGVLPFSPGDVVTFDGQNMLVREIKITGDKDIATARQEFILQPLALPYHPYRTLPKWPARSLWGWVTDNQKDPKQAGSVQVKFDFDPLDPSASDDRAWLPVMSPYGGGKSPSNGKAGSYNGFYSLPEVGERVLVKFLGDWDSHAVVVGAVRQTSVAPMFNAKNTKRWRLPSGTEIAMTSRGSTEIVRLRSQGKVFLECKLDGSNAEVFLTPGGSDSNIIHYQKGGGPSSLHVLSDGRITMLAQQQLHLEGQQVQITATGGNVNIDAAAEVLINCVPLPATPLQKQLFLEDKLSTSPEQRTLPHLPTATAATAAPAPSPTPAPHEDSMDEDPPLTWIEIVLKDDQGRPVGGERFSIKLPDGSTVGGMLDAAGKARVNGIKPGTAQVSFPDIDASVWKKA